VRQKRRDKRGEDRGKNMMICERGEKRDMLNREGRTDARTEERCLKRRVVR
jgi:hypothetical protein